VSDIIDGSGVAGRDSEGRVDWAGSGIIGVVGLSIDLYISRGE
jgi:hypothetical protein